MRCIAVPEVILSHLVDEAESLHSTLVLIGLRQAPAVASRLAALRLSLQEVGRIYHDALEDGEEANDVRLRRPEATREPAGRHG